MSVIGKFLKVQWRLTLDWPDFGFGGSHAALTRKRSPGGLRQLDYGQWIRILDDITATCERAGVGGRMHFYVSSRDKEPDYFLTFLEEVHSRGLGIRLLGRPTFVDETAVEVMVRLGIRPFHLRFMPRDRHPSEDGAPELEAAERAIGLLGQAKIPVRFRFVADESNLADYDGALRFVEDHQLRRFDVMRAVPQRGRQGQPNPGMSPERFRELLVHTQDVFSRWRAQGERMRLSGHRAEHLWWLLEWEEGKRDEPPPKGRAIHSCSVARNLLALRPDGTVWPCRRLALPIGLLPEQSIAQVLESPRLVALRRERPSCSGCPVANHCAGCYAMAYGTSGDPLAADPQCWWAGSGR